MLKRKISGPLETSDRGLLSHMQSAWCATFAGYIFTTTPERHMDEDPALRPYPEHPLSKLLGMHAGKKHTKPNVAPLPVCDPRRVENARSFLAAVRDGRSTHKLRRDKIAIAVVFVEDVRKLKTLPAKDRLATMRELVSANAYIAGKTIDHSVYKLDDPLFVIQSASERVFGAHGRPLLYFDNRDRVLKFRQRVFFDQNNTLVQRVLMHVLANDHYPLNVIGYELGSHVEFSHGQVGTVDLVFRKSQLLKKTSLNEPSPESLEPIVARAHRAIATLCLQCAHLPDLRRIMAVATHLFLPENCVVFKERLLPVSVSPHLMSLDLDEYAPPDASPHELALITHSLLLQSTAKCLYLYKGDHLPFTAALMRYCAKVSPGQFDFFERRAKSSRRSTTRPPMCLRIINSMADNFYIRFLEHAPPNTMLESIMSTGPALIAYTALTTHWRAGHQQIMFSKYGNPASGDGVDITCLQAFFRDAMRHSAFVHTFDGYIAIKKQPSLCAACGCMEHEGLVNALKKWTNNSIHLDRLVSKYGKKAPPDSHEASATCVFSRNSSAARMFFVLLKRAAHLLVKLPFRLDPVAHVRRADYFEAMALAGGTMERQLMERDHDSLHELTDWRTPQQVCEEIGRRHELYYHCSEDDTGIMHMEHSTVEAINFLISETQWGDEMRRSGIKSTVQLLTLMHFDLDDLEPLKRIGDVTKRDNKLVFERSAEVTVLYDTVRLMDGPDSEEFVMEIEDSENLLKYACALHRFAIFLVQHADTEVKRNNLYTNIVGIEIPPSLVIDGARQRVDSAAIDDKDLFSAEIDGDEKVTMCTALVRACSSEKEFAEIYVRPIDTETRVSVCTRTLQLSTVVCTQEEFDVNHLWLLENNHSFTQL